MLVTTKTKLLFAILVELCIISRFDPVQAIGCFFCSSRNGSNPDCEDPFHPGNMNSSYREKCKVPKRNHVGEFPAHFCVKVIGTSYATKEKLVIRRCTTHTMENQCGNFLFEDDLLKGCILTCELDGCNSSNRPVHSIWSMVAATAFAKAITFLPVPIHWLPVE